MDNREELIERSIALLTQVKDLTPGTAAEQWLNRTYGPGSDVCDNLARLIKAGVEQGGRRMSRSTVDDIAAARSKTLRRRLSTSALPPPTCKAGTIIEANIILIPMGSSIWWFRLILARNLLDRTDGAAKVGRLPLQAATIIRK
jgi:hypothetical protein